MLQTCSPAYVGCFKRFLSTLFSPQRPNNLPRFQLKKRNFFPPLKIKPFVSKFSTTLHINLTATAFFRMGFNRLFARFPKHLNKPTSLSSQSLLPNPVMGFHDSSSCSTISYRKDPYNMNNQVQLLHHYHSLSFFGKTEMGSVKHLSFLLGNQLESSRLIHSLLDTDKDQTDADKLCKILSTHNGSLSGIEASLNRSGVSKVSPELVEEVLKKMSNAGAIALSFFRWAEKKEGFKHTSDCYNALVEALGKIKQFKLIWNMVDEMKGKGLLTKQTFALIMRRYARARKTKEAVETFKKMEKFGMNPDLSDFNRLIDTLSKSRHAKRAHEVFDEMKKKRFLPDIRSYSILLEGWGEERNMLMVEEVRREMKDEGFEPDVVCYGIIINAYCKSRRYDEALEIVSEMEAKNCKLTPHIFCTLISGLGAAERLNEALEFFERSKTSGCVPEVATYNAVVRSYCWSMKFREAFMVIEEMKQCGLAPNSRTYEIILHHLLINRRTKEALSVFQRMQSEFGCEPSLNTYTMIVKMFCDEHQVDIAVEMWSQMKAKGILPSMQMFSSLINGFCEENRLDDACKYFQEMLDVGLRPPGQLYGNLKQALLDAGKKDLAISLGLKLDKIRKTPLVE